MLPPGWVGLPLTDPARVDQAIRRTVRALPLDDGDGARLRRELADDLQHQAGSARESGATYLAISGPTSAPISGSLLVTPLDRSLPLHDPGWIDGLEGEHETFTLPLGQVTRVVRERSVAAGRGAADGELPTLGFDYWIVGREGRQVQVACSTPLIAHREAMMQLFDTVIQTAEWSDVEASTP